SAGCAVASNGLASVSTHFASISDGSISGSAGFTSNVSSGAFGVSATIVSSDFASLTGAESETGWGPGSRDGAGVPSKGGAGSGARYDAATDASSEIAAVTASFAALATSAKEVVVSGAGVTEGSTGACSAGRGVVSEMELETSAEAAAATGSAT